MEAVLRVLPPGSRRVPVLLHLPVFLPVPLGHEAGSRAWLCLALQLRGAVLEQDGAAALRAPTLLDLSAR